MNIYAGIQKRIEKISKRINAPYKQLLTFGISRDDGTPCVQMVGDVYYYISRDRNTISFQKKTRDLEELLFWVFRDFAFEMAVRYEVRNRKQKIDPRRMIFSYQLELLEKINSEWAIKEREEIDELLLKFPFHDSVIYS